MKYITTFQKFIPSISTYKSLFNIKMTKYISIKFYTNNNNFFSSTQITDSQIKSKKNLYSYLKYDFARKTPLQQSKINIENNMEKLKIEKEGDIQVNKISINNTTNNQKISKEVVDFYLMSKSYIKYINNKEKKDYFFNKNNINDRLLNLINNLHLINDIDLYDKFLVANINFRTLKNYKSEILSLLNKLSNYKNISTSSLTVHILTQIKLYDNDYYKQNIENISNILKKTKEFMSKMISKDLKYVKYIEIITYITNLQYFSEEFELNQEEIENFIDYLYENKLFQKMESQEIAFLFCSILKNVNCQLVHVKDFIEEIVFRMNVNSDNKSGVEEENDKSDEKEKKIDKKENNNEKINKNKEKLKENDLNQKKEKDKEKDDNINENNEKSHQNKGDKIKKIDIKSLLLIINSLSKKPFYNETVKKYIHYHLKSLLYKNKNSNSEIFQISLNYSILSSLFTNLILLKIFDNKLYEDLSINISYQYKISNKKQISYIISIIKYLESLIRRENKKYINDSTIENIYQELLPLVYSQIGDVQYSDLIFILKGKSLMLINTKSNLNLLFLIYSDLITRMNKDLLLLTDNNEKEDMKKSIFVIVEDILRILNKNKHVKERFISFIDELFVINDGVICLRSIQ